MLARSTIIRHPLGAKLETPLLVPSFSSKGFRFNKENVSEVDEALRITAEVITESMLISAYDIYYEHISSNFATLPEIVFLDSGGYETSDDHDLSTVFRYAWPVKDWNGKMHGEILDSWPVHIPSVFVSFDHGSLHSSFSDQIRAARALFAKYPNQLNSIILKPENKKQRFVQLSSIFSNFEAIGEFDIIGITEKELGSSLSLRMRKVAKIRLALDEAGLNNKPLQIFGSLDPLSSCLYFLAGAEIFDGLTWLRYAYANGLAIYNCNYCTLFLGIHQRDDFLKERTIIENINFLVELQHEMRDFVFSEDYNKFKNNAEIIKKSYDWLCAKLNGRI